MESGPLFILEVIFALFLQEEHVPAVSFFEVMRLNLSEWPYLLLGTIGAVVNGVLQPSFSVIFSKIIGVGVLFVCLFFIYTHHLQYLVQNNTTVIYVLFFLLFRCLQIQIKPF